MTVTAARPQSIGTDSTGSTLTLDRLGPSFAAEVVGLDLRHVTDE